MVSMSFDPKSLLRLRNELGKSQTEMAKALRWSGSQYRKKEGFDKKFYEKPTLNHIEEISTTFGVDMSYFFNTDGIYNDKEILEKLRFLRELIDAKNETIASLKREIDLLRERQVIK